MSERDRNDAEGVSPRPATAGSTEIQARPSAALALEQSQLQRRADERSQRSIWVSFFVVLALSLALGVALALRHWAHGTNSTQGRGLPCSPASIRGVSA